MKNKHIGLFMLVFVALSFSCTVTETEEVEKKDTKPPAAISKDKIFVMAGDSAVLLSWTNPNDEDFYGTRITFEPGANNVTQPIVIEGTPGAASSTYFNGLSNDVEYTFSLVALDKSQNKSQKASKSSTPKSSADKTPPEAVVSPEAEAGNQKIMLSWTNPTDEDFYGVWISEKNSSGTLLNPVFLKSPARSFVVSELENAVDYDFSIIAIDEALNQSEATQISASPVDTSDKTPPAEAGSLSVRASDGSAILSWAGPDDDDFAGVEVSVNPAAGTLTYPVLVRKDTNSLLVSGLETGENYTFKVRTYDISYNFSAGTTKNVTVDDSSDRTPPAAVVSPEAEAGNQKIILSWTNPTDEDFYGVWIFEKNSSGTLLNPVFLKSPARSFVVSELENAVDYEFSIIAIDEALNQSEATQISASPVDTSDKTPPAEAGSLSVRASDGNAILSWAGPDDDDFAGVEVSVSPAAGTLTYPVLVRKDANSLLVSGLETGENYTFKVRTYDISYNFSAGTTKTVTVDDSSDRTPPAEVTNLTAVNKDGTILLTWTDATDTDSYGYEVSVNNSVYAVILQGAEKCFVSGLINGREYSFTVKSIDTNGSKSEGVTITATPEVIEISTLKIELSTSEELSNTEITVTVKVTSASAIKRVVYKKNGSENPAKLLADPEALPCHKVSKNDDTLWTFAADENDYWTVAALDVAGREETAQIYTQTIDKTPPAEVTNVLSQYIKALNAVSISWNDPADTNKEYESPFDHVVISYTIDGGAEVVFVPATIAKGTCSAYIENIQSDAEYYTFRVQSVDILGNTSEGVECKLNILNIIYATADDVVQKIGEMTQTCKIKVTGPITSTTISNIRTAIKKLAYGIYLKLDLSETTGLTSIGQYAFYGCSSLKSVVIPDSVTSIGISVFYGCSNLESVEIPDSITSIERSAFAECTSLESVVISDSVTSIGEYAFRECSSLKSVVIPDSVTSIERSAFAGCTSLKSVVIPDSVTRIESEAFSECSSLKSVVIPDSVTSIEGSAFQGCSSLESVVIPDSVTSIGVGAFSGCSSLNSVEIPDSVTSIGSNAFYGCSSLKSVVIPDSVTSIEDYAFQGCSSLVTITFTGTVDQWNAIEKGEAWKSDVPATKVVCSDGEVAL